MATFQGDFEGGALSSQDPARRSFGARSQVEDVIDLTKIEGGVKDGDAVSVEPGCSLTLATKEDTVRVFVNGEERKLLPGAIRSEAAKLKG